MRSVDVLVPKMPDQWPSACPQTSFAVPTWARQRGTWAVTTIIEKGKTITRKVGSNRARCGEPITEARRYMVVR